MFKFRILLYISAIVSCMLIAILFGTNQETAADQLRSKFDVNADENVILLTTENAHYSSLLLDLSDEEIDKITAHNKNRDKLLVISSNAGQDRSGTKSRRIRIQGHSLSKDIENLPELFAVIADNTALNDKLKKLTPMITHGEERNLASPFLSKIRQNEKDRIRLVQVLTFAFAKHHDMCYIVAHETK